MRMKVASPREDGAERAGVIDLGLSQNPLGAVANRPASIFALTRRERAEPCSRKIPPQRYQNVSHRWLARPAGVAMPGMIGGSGDLAAELLRVGYLDKIG
jgi:hypothetical protein